VLDPPVEGRFVDSHGVFDAVDTIRGRRVLVRFEWLTTPPDQPRWQQSFSYDDGTTWTLNWTMQLTRRRTE
jgi:hypothetical protein